MGARRFRENARAEYGLDLTEVQAREFRAAFFRAYPALRRWHRSIPRGPVADGLKLALLWERQVEVPGAFPVLVVHDEIVVECDAEQSAAAEARLRKAILDGMQPL